MSSWEQRERYLIDVAQRYLQGHKVFDLCRSHLVAASQISRGTVYNHFPSEADLVVAVAADTYGRWLKACEVDRAEIADPLLCFLIHHCRKLKANLEFQWFTIVRVMPNEALLAQASEPFVQMFNQQFRDYVAWNREMIRAIGELDGYDRTQLVTDFIRGNLINSDDAGLAHNNVAVYRQFCYALIQLLGQSDRKVPEDSELSTLLQLSGA